MRGVKDRLWGLLLCRPFSLGIEASFLEKPLKGAKIGLISLLICPDLPVSRTLPSHLLWLVQEKKNVAQAYY